MKKLILLSGLLLLLTVFFAQTSKGQTLVGVGQTYTNLKAAFDAINNGTLTGNVVLKITSNLTETTTAALYQTGYTGAGGTSSYSSVLIYPGNSGDTISYNGSSLYGLINLNGATNVTIDGRVNQTGVKDLVISNRYIGGAYAIQFINDAMNNTVTYCRINSNENTSTTGTIMFSTTTATYGNDNNTISYCDIYGGTNGHYVPIYASGTSAKTNDNITILNNNIYDFYSTSSAFGIYAGSNNNAWTISGNSFYETAAHAVLGTYCAIYISNTTGSGFTINGNYIGGSAPNCGGTPLTLNSASTTLDLINLNLATTAVTNVTNNTISNITITTTTGGTQQALILTQGGKFNITGNTLGSATTTGSINFTGNSTAGTFSAYGCGNSAPGPFDTINFSNNTIGGVNVAGAVAISLRAVDLCGATGTFIVNNNTFGSLTTANSLTNSTTGNTFIIITRNTYAAKTHAITNNTIANISVSGANSILRGVYSSGAINVNVTGNTVFNLSSTSANIGVGINANLIGILAATTGTLGQTVNNNTVYNLSVNNAAATTVEGIYSALATTGTNVVSGNKIRSLSLSTATNGYLIGLKVFAGYANYNNNDICLGLDNAGSPIITGYSFQGICDTLGPNNYYFNSVRITGTGVSGATASTYAFLGHGTSGIRQNNIFVNDRSGGTTGSHFAIKATTGVTLDYNDYYVNGTGTVLGYNGSNVTALPILTGQDANSVNVNPNFTSATNLQPTSGNYIQGLYVSSIPNDILGTVRNNPPDMGAYEELLPCVAPTFQPTVMVFTPNYLYINGSFTSSPTADHYLIIRSTSSSLSAVPVNGTTYAAGTAFGGGTIVAYQMATSFVDVNLSMGTQYYYFVYAVNSNCSGGPLYLTTSPLSQSVSTVAPASIHSVADGNWSSASTWSTNTVPLPMDSVFIENTFTVHVDAFTDSCYNLIVMNGGTLDATGTAGKLNVGSSIVNNGIINMYTSAATKATIQFTGSYNSSFTGTGTTDLNQLILNKTFTGFVTQTSPTLEINLPNLTINDLSTDVTGFLNATLLKGIVKFSGTNTLATKLFISTLDTIPTTGGVWLNNPNFTITGVTGDAQINGLLHISQGTYNNGIAINNSILLTVGSIFVMDGGTLNSAGRIYCNTAATFIMSNGTITVSTVGNTSTTGSFDYLGGSATNPVQFAMTGGTIILQNANSGTTKVDVRFPVGSLANLLVSGGTVQLGNANTQATPQNFTIDGKFWNVVVNNTTAQHGTKLNYGTYILNNFNNPGTGAFYLRNGTSGYTLICSGNFSMNGQVIGDSSTVCAIQFNGLSAQTFSCAPTSILGAVTMNNINGITITPAIINYGLSLTNGIMNCPTGTMTFGNGLANTFTLTKGYGNLSTTGVMNFNFTNMTVNYTLNDSVVLGGSIINNLLPPTTSGKINTFTLNNAKGLTLTKNLNVTTLALSAGKISTLNNVLTVMGTTVASITGYSATNFVNGTLARALPSGITNTGSWVFPLGTVSAAADTILYNPFTIINPSTGAIPYVKVSMMKGNYSGTAGQFMQTVNTDRRWYVTIDSGVFNYSRISVYDTNASSARMLGRSTTLNGTFNGLSSTLGTNTFTSTDSLTSIAPYYYAIGLKFPMSYVSSTTTQTNTAIVAPGTINQQILGLQISTLGNSSPLILSQINLNANGTTNKNDITNVKLYYTGTSSTFATTTVVDSTINISGSTFNLNPSSLIPFYLSEGTNYFWVTYDISGSAPGNDMLDAQCISITIDGIPRIPTVTNPQGNRIIFIPTTNVIFSENFDEANFKVPTDIGWTCPQTGNWQWQMDTVVTGWTSPTLGAYTPLGALSTSQSARYHSYGIAAATPLGEFISPIIDCSSNPLLKKQLEFYLIKSHQYAGGLNVYISYDNGSSWSTSLFTLGNSTAVAAWTKYSLNLDTTSSAQVKIKFTPVYYASSYGDIGLDQISLYTISEPNQQFLTSLATQPITTPVFSGVSNQQILTLKVVTQFAQSPMVVNSFDLSTNGSTNALADIDSAKIFYTGNSNTFATTRLFGSVQYPNSSFTISGTQSLRADTNYFWLVYNLKSTATEYDLIDAQFNTVSLNSSPYNAAIVSPNGSRTVRKQFNGIYTINNTLPTSGANYNNFTDAIIDLNTIGFSGPVTFNVSAGQTFNMTAPSAGAAITFSTAATAAMPIVFQKSGTGANPILAITGNSGTEYGIYFNGASYITLDGLKIMDAGVSTANFIDRGIGILCSSPNIGNSNITIKNCVIQMNQTNASSYCTYQYYGGVTPTSQAGVNNYIHYYNDSLLNSNSGMYVYGTSAFKDKNSEIGNCYINNLGGNAATVYGIYGYYQDSLQIYNTTISNVITTSTNYDYAITFYYANNANIYNNSIINHNVTYSVYSLWILYPSGITNIYGNTINNISSTSGTIYGVYVNSPTGTANIYNNVVSNLTESAGALYGLNISQGNYLGNFNIYNNKIYNLTYTGTSSYSIYAAYLTNSNTTTGAVTLMNFYNNMVYDIKTPGSTGASYALYTGTGNQPIRIYNNTFYVNYISTNVANAFYGIYAYNSSTYPNTLDIRNNIIDIKPNMTIGARSACFYSGTANATYSYQATCNNNLLYAGNPNPKNLLYFDGTNSDSTLAQFKNRMAPREGSDVTEDVPFVNGTTPPLDVHISTLVSTKTESHGQRITTPFAVSTDVDGNIRQGETGYNGTGFLPDLGASEFNGITYDDVPPSITYTNLPNSTSLTGITLNNISITDPLSGLNVTTVKPRVYYKKASNTNTFNDNTNATDGWKYYESSSTTSPFNFTLDYSKIYTGVSYSDTIMYFFIAQDNMTPTPNTGGDAAIYTSVPTTTSLVAANFPVIGYKSYLIANPLNGTYYVGSGQTFTSLTSATNGFFNYINNNVVTGNVTIKVVSNTTETGAVQLNPILTEGVGNYSLTIKAIDTATNQVVISGGLASSGLIRIAASNVIFDGAINGSGINLQVCNTNSGGYTLQYLSGSNNCTVKNTFIHGTDYQVCTGVYINSGNVNNLSFINDSINNCLIGFYVTGSTSAYNNNLTFKNILFGSYRTGWKMHTNALNLAYVNGLTIDNNTFNAWTYSANAAAPKVILLNAQVTNVNITRNNFFRILGEYATGGTGASAIEINTVNAASNINIINNVIDSVLSGGASSWSFNAVAAIRLLGTTGGVKIYNNSINMFGNSNQYFTTQSAPQLNAGIYIASGVSNLDIRNNIINNTISSPTVATSRSYAIYSDAPASAFTNIDYNIYNVNGPQGVLGHIGTDTNSIAGWRSKTLQDAHSLFTDPIFTSNSNLSPSKCPTSPAIAIGSPLATVTTDFLNKVRSQFNPTIGAYELDYAKKMNVTAVMQEYYNSLTHALPMTQTLDMDMNTGDMFSKFAAPIVDTISIQIRSTMAPDYPVEYEYNGYNLNVDGTITPEISLPSGMTGYRYIVINHRNSIETWSDSTDFSCLGVDYNFYTHPISTSFPGNMFVDSLNNTYYGSTIWGGDVGYDLANPSRDGIINIFDLSSVFDAINDPSGIYSAGYIAQDLNGDGVVNIYDLSLVFDNLNAGASSINPFTMKKKK